MSNDERNELFMLEMIVKDFLDVLPGTPTAGPLPGIFWEAAYRLRTQMKILNAVREIEDERAKLGN